MILKTLEISTSPITLNDFGAITIGVHPSSLKLEEDYGLLLEEVLASEELFGHIEAGRLSLEVDGIVVPLSDFGDKSAGLSVDPFRTVANATERLALKSLTEGDSVLQEDDGTFYIYDGNRLVNTNDPNIFSWTDISDPLVADQIFYVTGMANGDNNLDASKTYQFIVPEDIDGEDKGDNLTIDELDRYELVGEIPEEEEIIEFVQLNVRNKASGSFGIFSNIRLFDKDGNLYPASYWKTIEGSSSTYNLGINSTQVSGGPEPGRWRTVRLGYFGGVRATGLSAIEANFRGDFESTILHSIVIRTNKNTFTFLPNDGAIAFGPNTKVDFEVQTFTSLLNPFATKSQHDSGRPTPDDINPFPGTQAYLEDNGGGYKLSAVNYQDNWYSSLTNTTSTDKTVTFNGFDAVYRVNGQTRTAITTSFTIPTNTRYRLEVAVNPDSTKVLQVIEASGSSEETGAVVESDALLGQLFYSTTNRVRQGLCYAGNSYNWSDNPKLKALFDANSHDFITDNEDGTFTVADHTDFLRAGTANIGTHVDDTTAVNGLRANYTTNGGEVDFATPSSILNNAGSTWQSNGTLTENSRVISSNDTETAPDHRVAYFGVYGDITILAATVPTPITVIDEDDFISDSDTAIPTQQSVKAYVDNNKGIAEWDADKTYAANDVVTLSNRLFVAKRTNDDKSPLTDPSIHWKEIGGDFSDYFKPDEDKFVNLPGTWSDYTTNGLQGNELIKVTSSGSFDFNADPNNLVDFEAGDVIQYQVDEWVNISEKFRNSLRGQPVATIADLIKLKARDFEIRKVSGVDRTYVFKAGKTPKIGDVQDEAETGAWELQESTKLEPINNYMRVGKVVSSADGDQTFLFDEPFTDEDGTTDDDIIVSLTKVGSNIGIPLGIKSSSLTGFVIDRNDSVNADHGVHYIAINKAYQPKQIVASEENVYAEPVGDVVFKLNQWTGDSLINNDWTTIETNMDWTDAEYVEFTIRDNSTSHKHRTYRGDMTQIKAAGTDLSLLLTRYDTQYCWIKNVNVSEGSFEIAIINSDSWRLMKTTLWGYKSITSIISNTLNILDEDDFASNSATAVPSQQSTKAYVDGKVGVEDDNFKKVLKGKTVESLQDLADEVDSLPIAQPFYIDTDNGDDTNTGSQDSPLKTLNGVKSLANLTIFIKGAADISGRVFAGQFVAINTGWVDESDYKDLTVTDEGSRFTGKFTTPLTFISCEATINGVYRAVGITMPAVNVQTIRATRGSHLTVVSDLVFDGGSNLDCIFASEASVVYVDANIQVNSFWQAFLHAEQHSEILINNAKTITAADGKQGNRYFNAETNGYIHIGSATHGNDEIVGATKIRAVGGGIVQRSETTQTIVEEYGGGPQVDSESAVKGWSDYRTNPQEIAIKSIAGGITSVNDTDYFGKSKVLLFRNTDTTSTLQINGLEEGTVYVGPGKTITIYKSGNKYYRQVVPTQFSYSFTATSWTEVGDSYTFSISRVELAGKKFLAEVRDSNGNVVLLDMEYISNGVTLKVNKTPDNRFAGTVEVRVSL